MAEGEDVLRARITATDDASATIAQIKARVHALGEEFHHAGEQSEHLHHPHMWSGLTEHVNILHEHVGGLTASFGEMGSSMSELLPVLGAFGAASSLVGLFETVEHVSEAQAQLAHTAAIIGVTSAALQQLDFVAKMTDTSVESMHTGLEKLNKVIAESASGKNKDAAALFRHLGISLRDSNGHLKSSATLLPVVADAIMHTGNAAMRARMAMALMGRGGQEMIPLLAGGGDKIRELSEESKRLNFTPDDSQRENLLKYADAMKELHASVQGFTDNLGADLAPVLLPIVDHAKDWILAHRAGIANIVAGRLSIIGAWAEAGGIERVEAGVERFGETINGVVEAFGGWGRAAELLAGIMVVKGALFLFEPIKEVGQLSIAIGKLIYKLGVELVGAWAKVGASATAAAVEEEAAAVARHAGAPVPMAVPASIPSQVAAALARNIAPVTVIASAGYAAQTLSDDSIARNSKSRGATEDQAAADVVAADTGVMLDDAPHPQASSFGALGDYLGHLFAGRDKDPSDGSRGADTWNGWTLPQTADGSGRATLPEIDHGGGPRVPDGHVQVDVNLVNAPQGTTATATSSGQGLGGPRVNVGHAWGGGDPFALAF